MQKDSQISPKHFIPYIEQILQPNGLLKNQKKNPKNYYSYNNALQNQEAMVCSSDVDTDFFDIVAGGSQGDRFEPYLFILCLDYILQTSIDLIKT